MHERLHQNCWVPDMPQAHTERKTTSSLSPNSTGITHEKSNEGILFELRAVPDIHATQSRPEGPCMGLQTPHPNSHTKGHQARQPDSSMAACLHSNSTRHAIF
jgi:hypothetical protein